MGTVRLLTPHDIPACVALRREALEAHPLSFGASPAGDHGFAEDALRRAMAEGSWTAYFGWFDSGLAGMVRLVRPAEEKRRHMAYIHSMYVSARCRGQGAGRALLAAAIDQARGWPGVIQVQLSVTSDAPEARRLYGHMGFREWGAQPRALRWGDRTVDEYHLILDLDTGAPAA
jgi:GNAT superfamily N-acetyltransferase